MNATWYGTWPLFPGRNVGICPGSMLTYGFMTRTGIIGIIPGTDFFFLPLLFFDFKFGSDDVIISSSLSSKMGARPGEMGVAFGASSSESSR